MTKAYHKSQQLKNICIVLLLIIIKGNFLKLFQSYLSGRTFSVHLGHYSSAAATRLWGPSKLHFTPNSLFFIFAFPGFHFKETQYLFPFAAASFAVDLQVYLP